MYREKPPLQTYHLYHHQPDPLPPEKIHEQAWLRNNGATYSIVAVIEARSPEDAYLGLQEKMAGQRKRTRFLLVQEGNLLRPTLPGDVLVGEQEAWMVFSASTLHPIKQPYATPYRSYEHHGYLQALSWSPCGRYLAAGDGTGDVLIHDVSSADESHYHAAHYKRHRTSSIHAVAWSPDGSRIASGGHNGEVHIWTVNPQGGYRGAERGSIVICRKETGTGYHEEIFSLSWSASANAILAGRDNGHVLQWEARTGDCWQETPRHARKITDVARSPDGTRFASASEDTTVHIWKPDEPVDQAIVYRTHQDPVTSVDWSPDGSLMISCDTQESCLHLWRSATGVHEERLPLSIGTTRPLCAKIARWSPTGTFIAAGCNDGTLQLMDVKHQRHIHTYRTSHTRIDILAWSPDGRFIATGGSDGGSYYHHVRIWQVEQPLNE